MGSSTPREQFHYLVIGLCGAVAVGSTALAWVNRDPLQLLLTLAMVGCVAMAFRGLRQGR
jgi:hypothetical protein